MSEVDLTVGVKGPGLQKGTLKVILKWKKRPMSNGEALSAQEEGYIALEGGPSIREYTRLLLKRWLRWWERLPPAELGVMMRMWLSLRM